MIIGIRGEYNGAQIQIFNGEKIYIGRSSESNLVLSNKRQAGNTAVSPMMPKKINTVL